jgi:hypothetical protein
MGFSGIARSIFLGWRVLDLRSRYGEPKKQINDPLKYCDLSYYEHATK